MTMQRTFHPINGVELKKMILKDVEDMLTKNSDFNQNICYPHINYEVTVRCVSYPRDPEEFKSVIEGGSITVDEQTKESFKPSQFEKPKILEINRERNASSETQPPDKTRIETGLPVLTRAKDAETGITVDREMQEEPAEVRGSKTKTTIKNRASQGFKG